MPFESAGEIYFVAGMMILSLILSIFATYFFVRQYKKEKAQKEQREIAEAAKEDQKVTGKAKVD